MGAEREFRREKKDIRSKFKFQGRRRCFGIQKEDEGFKNLFRKVGGISNDNIWEEVIYI